METNLYYETKIQDNPIEILKSINILMHKPERSNYPSASITETSKRVVNIKHKYNKSRLDYLKRLKQGKDILKEHVGRDVLGNYLDNVDEFKNEIIA